MHASLITALAALSHLAQAVTDVTIFAPPSSYTVPRVLYARTLLLNQSDDTGNVLLATWENYSPEPPYFPIYRSADEGATWNEISQVHDTVNGWGLRYQPFLYELPEAIGNFSAGTILLAGNSIPADLSQTKIDLYASTDKGVTWTFVSSVARGGEAIPNNGLTPVWEPFILMWQGTIIVYYSDQRDPAYGQKLVHQVSSDLLTWEDPVNDVTYDTYDFRPGMPTVAQLADGQFIMTYEFYGAPEGAFAAYYKIAADPTNFGNSTGYVIEATDGTIPVSSPYVVWSSAGGPSGTVAVSDNEHTEIFLNHDITGGGEWTTLATSESASYSRSLRVLPDQSELLIAGAGVLNGTNNTVTVSTVEIA